MSRLIPISLILTLTLLTFLNETLKPTFRVYPRISPSPATITLLVTNIPDGSRVACFALDGDNGYYGGCRELSGERSLQVQYKDVRTGHYEAGVAIDGKIVGQMSVEIIGY